jgi:hypothetical protein
MHELIEKLIARLPLDFRVLYRQFLLRVIDLEALSIQADVTRLHRPVCRRAHHAQPDSRHGHLSRLHVHHGTCASASHFCGTCSTICIATMMLVVGHVRRFSWDATFPDRSATSWCCPPCLLLHAPS